MPLVTVLGLRGTLASTHPDVFAPARVAALPSSHSLAALSRRRMPLFSLGSFTQKSSCYLTVYDPGARRRVRYAVSCSSFT